MHRNTVLSLQKDLAALFDKQVLQWREKIKDVLEEMILCLEVILINLCIL